MDAEIVACCWGRLEDLDIRLDVLVCVTIRTHIQLLTNDSFTGVVNYSMSYFLPIILRSGMGFDLVESQCLVAPPYAFTAIYMYAVGWLGDKYHVRGPIVALNALVAVVGLPIMVL